GLGLRGSWVDPPPLPPPRHSLRSRGEENRDASLQARLQKRRHEDFSETIVPRPTGADVILFPAIDLKDGLCVRLEQGDRARATIFHRDPAAQALAFEVQGWAEISQLSALDVARRFEDAGVAAIIFTEIARDGLLQGLNLDSTIALAEAVKIPVVASGGLASLDDVRALTEPRAKKLAGA